MRNEKYEIAKLDTARLVEAFDATVSGNFTRSSTVRGWMMDVMEARNPEAFKAWLEGAPTTPAREYFLTEKPLDRIQFSVILIPS
jgi:hypothetical protein